LTVRKNSFVERTQPLQHFSKRSGAGSTNKSRFNWIFMKLPNSSKKQKTRPTLFTTKIMGLIKKKMRFQDFRLCKIGDHIKNNTGSQLLHDSSESLNHTTWFISTTKEILPFSPFNKSIRSKY
jgi:hypothetical protein